MIPSWVSSTARRRTRMGGRRCCGGRWEARRSGHAGASRVGRAMLRLTELKLRLDHPHDALRDAVLERLGVAPDDLLSLVIARRGYDARRRSAISLVYAVDVGLRDESSVLARFAGNPQVRPAPDTRYRFPVHVDAPRSRPVVIGTGPCGLMAALTLAQMGFRPLIF